MNKYSLIFVFALLAHHAASAVTSDDWEQELLSIPRPKNLRGYLYDLTRHAHVAGTKGDYEDAQYVYDKFKAFGLEDVRMDKVRTMLSYPKQEAQLFSSFYRAKLAEDILEQDETSDTIWRNHTFLAYSPPGTVTAKLVYANYGTPQDFQALESLGVSVEGAIVIMRYGECFRGLKIMNAEQRGAIGSIIYSDPQQDGFTKGPTWPDGPWRPPSAVQRGSVQFNTRCAGDPWRLYLKNTTSVDEVCGYNTSDLVPSHPALPISYEDALPFLKALGGHRAPCDFHGGLNISYTVGPSYFDVTLKTFNRNYPSYIPNIIATIPGTQEDNSNIILGNHRDAWVFGAVDPNSGTAVLIELARALSVLLKQGWKPRRSIILASWSGEEYGLLGSTAYAEMNPDIVNATAAYLNVDVGVSGNVSLTVSATHSLTDLFIQATREIEAPNEPSKTLYDKWTKTIETLGSGSDYTVFLDRFGVASLDMSYEGSYGVYHSIYDSFSWMDSAGDPTFECHQAMTRLWSLMAFRLASNEVLPFLMEDQALQIATDVGKLANAASIAGVDLTSLVAAVESFHEAALSIDAERDAINPAMQTALRRDTASTTKDINIRLAYTERRFLGDGLPNRPWFRHILQAPGYFLGYGSQPFPGIVESIADGRLNVARSEVLKAATAIKQAALFLVGAEDASPPEMRGK